MKSTLQLQFVIDVKVLMMTITVKKKKRYIKLYKKKRELTLIALPTVA